MSKLPLKLPLELMAPKWASQLDPVLANPVVQGLELKNINLTVGDNVINHLLGRKQQGWFITDINAVAGIYRSAEFNALTLTLNSDVECTINLWVF